MSEPLLEELARWLLKYKRRCKYCGKYDAEKLLDIKILKSFETYGMSGLGRLCSFQKSIYSIEKL
jgi:hypothetical protein